MTNIILIVLLAILIIMLTFKKSKIFLLNNLDKLKEYFNEKIEFIIKESITFLLKIESKFPSKEITNDNLNLEDLTANLRNDENKEQLETYLNSLKFAILNKNVTNIALTGGFGSGKSTIVNEFIKQNKEFEYLPISLANFSSKDDDEKLIETSIVQQILYFEKKKKINESSFQRINFSKPFTKIFNSIIIGLWIYSNVYLFFDKLNNQIFIWKNIENITTIFFQLIFIIGVIIIIYKSFDTIKNIKLSKLTHQSIEIVNEKTDKNLSIFNRNIEEIIYFFEKTNTNIVIIEDIDRFSDKIAIKLLSKIRELSIIIKQSKDIKQPVKFIYSVKDEINITEKTKFFDFIIPVIPIIDYNNSKNKFFEKLNNYFESKENKKSLDKNFIAEVSNYIYDMRKVINICNEFKNLQ